MEFKKYILFFGRKKNKIFKDFLFIKLKVFFICLLYVYILIVWGIFVLEEEILKGNSEWIYLDSLMVLYFVLIFLLDNIVNLD